MSCAEDGCILLIKALSPTETWSSFSCYVSCASFSSFSWICPEIYMNITINIDTTQHSSVIYQLKVFTQNMKNQCTDDTKLHELACDMSEHHTTSDLVVLN